MQVPIDIMKIILQFISVCWYILYLPDCIIICGNSELILHHITVCLIIDLHTNILEFMSYIPPTGLLFQPPFKKHRNWISLHPYLMTRVYPVKNAFFSFQTQCRICRLLRRVMRQAWRRSPRSETFFPKSAASSMLTWFYIWIITMTSMLQSFYRILYMTPG